MAFPFLYLVIALAMGIAVATQVHLPFLFSFLLLFLALVGAWLAYWRGWAKTSLALALAATFLIGMILYTHEDRAYQESSLHRFDLPVYADFTGYLYRSPSFGPGVTFLFLKVERVHFKNREEEIRGNMRVSVFHRESPFSPLRLRAGDRVRVSAQVYPVRDFFNFNEPRLANLRKHQRFHSQAVSKSVALVEKLGEKKIYFVRAWFSALRMKLLRAIETHFRTPRGDALSQEGTVLEAMLLGERGRLDEQTTRRLQQSGLYHLIAISGAHIAILSFLLYGALRLLRLGRRASSAALMFFLLFYALLVEGRPSVFRATFMALAYLAGKLLWKNVHVLNTISFSAFFLLLYNPFFLLDMGFELTFAATYSIILFLPRLLKHLPYLPLRISELFALSLTAQLGVLPFLVRSFNRVTFSALFLNLVAVPLAGLIMGLGFLFLAFSLLSSSLAGVVSGGLGFLVRLLVDVSCWLDFIPFFSYRVPTPHLVTVLAYFAFLVLLLLRTRFKGQRAVVWLGFLTSFIVLVSYPFPPSSSPALKLTFLDVGQGESTFVQFPGHRTMLIDGGGVPDDRFDVGEHVVSPFLWRKGLKKIDYLVLTHAHPDHMNGLKAVARNFRVRAFWEAYSPPENQSYEQLMAALGSSPQKQRVFAGFSLEGGGVRFQVLHPEAIPPLVRNADNEESLVLLISMGEVSFLLPADIGAKTEEDIARRFPNLHVQVLKSPHHGSRTSSSPSFLEHVRPDFVVISAGRGNAYGVPHPEVLERYEKLGARVFRTDRDGAIEIATDGQNIVVRTARQVGPGKPVQD